MILQAYTAACRSLGFSSPGLKISLDNEIPFKRGLGSSAAAIIGGIKLAEGFAGKRISTEEIFNIAYPLEKHPDNLAASCLGGWALSLVTGGRMRALPLESHLDVDYIVVIPEFTVSTSEAREILPGSYPLQDAVYNIQRTALLVHAVREGIPDLLREAVGDRLHQHYRASLVPGMKELLEREGLDDCLKGDLLTVTVSGSGSAMLAMTAKGADSRAVGEWMRRVFAENGIAARYRILELDRQGARFD
jgi:homoserine kinase